MIELSELRMPCGTDRGRIRQKAARMLHLDPGRLSELQILKHSIDSRRKPELLDVYTVAFSLPQADERRILQKNIPHVREYHPMEYQFPQPGPGTEVMQDRPVVVGAGPAGLFASYMLALHGYRPVLIEQGRPMEERTKDVESFWAGGTLRPYSNIQFGEGGAGTFSDGKLNTLVKDRMGRNEEVLRIFVSCGAPEEILYEGKPHIGTDLLRGVIVRLRREIIRLGGEVRFGTKLTGLEVSDGKLRAIRVRSMLQKDAGTGVAPEADTQNSEERWPVCAVILAPGHSARDLFRELRREHIPLEAKDFAIGCRVMHPQALINRSQYGVDDPLEMKRLKLPPASYKLTARASSGRGVYSFCMCPGGYVVNASSEPGRLAVNGMSNYDRGSLHANSAIVITISQKDYGGTDPLDGCCFQERLEEKCWAMADGAIPVERFSDFAEGTPLLLQNPLPENLSIRGAYAAGELHNLLPENLTRDFVEGMRQFDHRIPGFAGEEAFVAGLESRTSSPVRIPRDSTMQSVGLSGLYPCGEGAGYAGGIMSAAMDGIRAAEAVGRAFRPYAENPETQ